MPGKNGVVHDDIKCYAYQTLGHYAYQCTRQTGTKFAQTVIMFSQGQNGIKNTFLLLYTCLSNSVSNNPIMVKNVDKYKNKDISMVQTDGGLKKFLHPKSTSIYPSISLQPRLHINHTSIQRGRKYYWSKDIYIHIKINIHVRSPGN